MAKAWQDDNLILSVDYSWSDDYGFAMRGWILSKKQPIQSLEIEIGDRVVAVTNWEPRPDVVAAHPEYAQNEKCGFILQIPRMAEHHVTFNAKTASTTISKSVDFLGSKPPMPYDFSDGGQLFDKFVDTVNTNHLRVLEIGSRLGLSDRVSNRQTLSGAASFTGFDYYPDHNTDVVGDAHKLSQYFPNQKFDAIFSLSVFEHLAMPWLVAMEINKCLEIGGLTFHATHFAWPLHETPWDFWRFSDNGLKVLFSPAMGFEIVAAGLFHPLRMHLDSILPGQELFPAAPAFGGSAIIAKKVADFNPDKFKWDVELTDVVGADSHYPKPQ